MIRIDVKGNANENRSSVIGRSTRRGWNRPLSSSFCAERCRRPKTAELPRWTCEAKFARRAGPERWIDPSLCACARSFSHRPLRGERTRPACWLLTSAILVAVYHAPTWHYRRLVVVAVVVALQEPVMSSGRDVFLVKANSSSAKPSLRIAVQMFKVQFHQMRIVEIGRKVVTGPRRIPAHEDDRFPNLGRQPFDMLRIPGIVVANLTAASECARLGAQQNQDNPGSDRRKPRVKSSQASPLTVEDLPDALATPTVSRTLVFASGTELSKFMGGASIKLFPGRR
jgi:hypothetical protein